MKPSTTQPRFGWSNETPATIGEIMRINKDETLSTHVTNRKTLFNVSPGDVEVLSVYEVNDWVHYDWFSVGRDSIATEFIGSHSVSVFVVSVSVLSCEVASGDTTSYRSLYSRAGFGIKDAISVVGDLKFLLNVSKAVGKLYIEQVSKILRIHGKFGDVVSSVHSDDEHSKLKRKRRTWYLQKKEAVVFSSCEAGKMAGTEAIWIEDLYWHTPGSEQRSHIMIKVLRKLNFKEMRGFIGVQDVSEDEFKLKGENVGLSLKKKRKT